MTEEQIKEFNCFKIEYSNKPVLFSRVYNNAKSAIIIMDMVAGFCQKGALYSPRNEALVDKIAGALDYLPLAVKFFINDKHTPNSIEFASYPQHCHILSEQKLTKDLQKYKGIIIEKDSTNGIFQFLKYADTSLCDNFLIMGNCTDICILQFALSLKAYFNENARRVNVIVFADYVDTYDLPMHNADLFNIMALKNMEQSGIQIFQKLT